MGDKFLFFVVIPVISILLCYNLFLIGLFFYSTPDTKIYLSGLLGPDLLLLPLLIIIYLIKKLKLKHKSFNFK
jgi:hypothetical protein